MGEGGLWDALTCYTADGRREISNKAAERAIWPLAIGRKKWLGAGSNTGGHGRFLRSSRIAFLIRF